jgi:hypothetical protein
LEQVPLQRYVVSAVVDLAETLDPQQRAEAAISVLVWIAVRRGTLPVHGRIRRVLDFAPAERIDRLFGLVEQLGLAGRGSDREIAALGELAGERGRLGGILARVARELAAASSRRPEAHWSGLPKLDLVDLAAAADELALARDEAQFALTHEPIRAGTAASESLRDRAAKLNRTLTSASLKFVDAARRAEITEHYVSELSAICEAIANGCGPIVGNPVRAQLARSLVAVRAQASEASRDRAEDVRYIARLRVLGALASASEGGMTNTYLAEGPAPGKRVVVKLLPWERFPGASAEVARSLFEGEMQRLAPIVHPNVVSIIDAGFVDEGAYIALEHIPGSSLESLLRTLGKLDLPTLAPIIHDAARGLAFLHARGIVHRDIKPGNILVQLDPSDRDADTPERWVRSGFIRSVVIDLGIATDARGTGTENETGIVGTPGFLAPEVARGLGTITPAVDVYALAVVAFEALTGTNPFLEGEPELPALLVRHGTMLLPLEQLPEAAQRPALMHLLAEAGKHDPRARPTMAEFGARWDAAVAGLR